MKTKLLVFLAFFRMSATISAQVQADASGNVGVGATTPQQKLEVAGTLRLSYGSEYSELYFQGADVSETCYNSIWPDQHERAFMIKPYGCQDVWDAGGVGLQFFTYDVTGGSPGSYSGGYHRAMVIRKNGNVGMGTATPDHRLTVEGDIRGRSYLWVGAMPASPDGQFRIVGQQGVAAVEAAANRKVYLYSDQGDYGVGAYDYNAKTPLPLTLGFNDAATYLNLNGGSVGIGTKYSNGCKLAGNGSAIFTKAVVRAYGNWSNYVFSTNYRLPSLAEVEVFIKQHEHLPQVSSAKEVAEKGLNLGDNQAVLLKKIEELTLYVIEANKKISARGTALNT